jgi:hypothetical protein
MTDIPAYSTGNDSLHLEKYDEIDGMILEIR